MREILASFPTDTGHCDVYADRLALTKEGATNKGPVRQLALYCLLVMSLFFLAYNAWQRQAYAFTIFFGLLGLIILLGQVARSLITSTSPVIDRAAIQRIVYRAAQPGTAPACFVVLFHAGSRLRQRLIQLPDSASEAAALRAQDALRAAGLPVEELSAK